ncbi:unnamed protein product [Amoebophrya sp. A25]|nr:unnamed protein product [Amoebophrya sp. A25]|eukprot:GSA25T00010514001.1
MASLAVPKKLEVSDSTRSLLSPVPPPFRVCAKLEGIKSSIVVPTASTKSSSSSTPNYTNSGANGGTSAATTSAAMTTPSFLSCDSSREDIYIVGYRGEDDLRDLIPLIECDLSEPYSIFTYRYFVNQWPELFFVAVTLSDAGKKAMQRLDSKEKHDASEPVLDAATKNIKEEDSTDLSGDLAAIEKENMNPLLSYDDKVANILACRSHTVVVGGIISKLEAHKSSYFPAMRGYIAMLAVDKEFRRRGLGRRIVQVVLTRMEELGGHECVLETELVNDKARRLYESLGFIKTKRLESYYLNGLDAFRFKYVFPPRERMEQIKRHERMEEQKARLGFR